MQLKMKNSSNIKMHNNLKLCVYSEIKISLHLRDISIFSYIFNHFNMNHMKYSAYLLTILNIEYFIKMYMSFISKLLLPRASYTVI